ncbi:MAG TPA: hypothetical protein VMY69_08495, partial [Phycisphaerae bacterium]|nr:hypothetical protein [Phycisphaerae bacterium]
TWQNTMCMGFGPDLLTEMAERGIRGALDLRVERRRKRTHDSDKDPAAWGDFARFWMSNQKKRVAKMVRQMAQALGGGKERPR